MTHPVTELIVAAGVIVAIGAGAVAVLPQERTPAATIRLAPPAASTTRAEAKPPLTNAERVEVLRRTLSDIAAEHKRLAAEVKALSRERKPR